MFDMQPSLEEFQKWIRENDFSSFSDDITPAAYLRYCARTEAQWLRRFPEFGDDIYNYIHPQTHGISFILIN